LSSPRPAARGAGKVLVIDAISETIVRDIVVGPKPNGLAWDVRRKRFLVADVGDFRARLIDPQGGVVVADTALPGRPRWCVYDPRADRFLVNVLEPACVAVLAADSAARQAEWPVSSAGPHGLDLDGGHGRVFVACDGAEVLALDLDTGRELARVAIAGAPDAMWYNPVRSCLYVAIGPRGVIDVVDTREMRLAQEVPTEEGAHTTAFDRARQLLHVFLPRRCRAATYEEV
jgi:DNA-binding beta-propeller fold protein YncE